MSRIHAIVFGDERKGLCVLDLVTSNGTKLVCSGDRDDGIKIGSYIPYVLNDNTFVTLGASSRQYHFSLDLEAQQRRREALYSRVANFSSEGEDDTTVFVGNLTEGTTETDVRQFFEGCGEIKKISVPNDKNTGKNKIKSSSHVFNLVRINMI